MFFKLNDIDFCIDLNNSNVSFSTPIGNKIYIREIRISASKEQLKAIQEKYLDFEWFLYPPTFHVRDIEAEMESDGFSISYGIDDLDDIDSSLILVEHKDVDGVTINILSNSLNINGTVMVNNRMMNFSIAYDL